MRPLLTKFRPTSGFAQLVHLLLQVILPIAILVLVRLDFVQLAFSLIVLSKWRMFAVRPRFWPANIRANAVDMMVGFSIVIFMMHASNAYLQLVWAILFGTWLIFIKPASSLFMISTQAFIGQLCALMALYLAWAAGPLYGLTLLTGLACYLAARHFFDSFDEAYAKLLSYVWGYFGAALAWLLSHWLLFYRGIISQPTLLLSAIGYGLAVLYYLDHTGRLNKSLKRQFVGIMLVVVIIVLAFSDWGNKIV